MNIYTPYTYLIGWSKLNWWYYGVQYRSTAKPSNLWTSYFTSSKEVAIVRDMYGEPDIIQIRHTFDDPSKARKWETKVLKSMDVIHDDKWLNRHNNIAFSPKKSARHRNSIAKALTGKAKSKDHLAKLPQNKKGYKRTNPSSEKSLKYWKSKRKENLTPKEMLKFYPKKLGKENSMYGKKQTQKMIDSISIPVELAGKIFTSYTQCIKQTGLSFTIITNYKKYNILPQRGNPLRIFKKMGLI